MRIQVCLAATIVALLGVSAAQAVTTQDPLWVLDDGTPFLWVEAETLLEPADDPNASGYLIVDKFNPFITPTEDLGVEVPNGGLPALPPDTNALGSGAGIMDMLPGGADTATYELVFTEAGTYSAYGHITMFNRNADTNYGSEDSFYIPPAFNMNSRDDWIGFEGVDENGDPMTGDSNRDGWMAAPNNRVIFSKGEGVAHNTTEEEYWDGEFHWHHFNPAIDMGPDDNYIDDFGMGIQYEVTEAMVGQTVTFEISTREAFGVHDGFLFAQSPDLLSETGYEQEELQAQMEAFFPPPVRSYGVAQRSAPTIDGVVGVDEWDGVPRTGNFTLLRQPEGTAENANWEVAATWDNDGMYLLLTTDFSDWTEGANADNEGEDCSERLNCDMDFGLDNVNLYIDPNNGDLDNTEATNGYQIAFNLNEGNSFYRDGEATRTGVFQEAHVNSGFGNQGQWGTGENDGTLLWSFESNTDGQGGVVEVAIPWDALDAPGPDDEGGVLVDGAPTPGDEWYVNFGIISTDSDNFLPVWQWNSSQSFVTRPDGVFTFLPGGLACDINEDGSCDANDIDAMTQLVMDGERTQADRKALIDSAFPAGLNSWVGDSDENGQFDEQDFVKVFIEGKYLTGEKAGYVEGDWDGNFLADEQDFVAAFIAGGYLKGQRPAVSAVPEPSSLVLLALGMLAFARRRR